MQVICLPLYLYVELLLLLYIDMEEFFISPIGVKLINSLTDFENGFCGVSS